MKTKGVIFDLDGVLCSTDEYHYLAWKTLAEKLGIENFTRADNARQRGVSRMESLEVVLEKSGKAYSSEEKLRFADYKNEIYKEMLQNMSPSDLSADVRHTLETLSAKGIKTAVGSSSKNTPAILERLGLSNFFGAVADGNDITRSKPDPEVFLLAASRLSLLPADCIVVEDAESGVDAGLAGGFRVAALGDALKCGKATYALDKLSDLLKIL